MEAQADSKRDWKSSRTRDAIYTGVFVCLVLLGCAHARVTSVTTKSYQSCNTVPPLTCSSSPNSTFLTVAFSESLDGSPTTVLTSPWTVVADNTNPTLTNEGLDKCSSAKCQKLRDPLYVDIKIVRAVLAFKLVDTGIRIPYGYYINSLVNIGNNQSVLMDPTLLAANTNCTGRLAQLYAPRVCSETAPSIGPSVFARCGAYADTPMIANTTWLENSRPGGCNGVICYQCPASGIPASKLYTLYAYGPQCALYQISDTTDQTNYEVDVFVNITSTAIGGISLGSIYFTSLANMGSGPRITLSNLARGKFTRLSVSGASRQRLQSFEETLVGGVIAVCSADGNPVFDQGFFNPWQNIDPVNVPTALGTGTKSMWFYLNKNQAALAYGASCGKQGDVMGLASAYSGVNLTNACLSGAVLNGTCVPGYSNSTLTPCQIASVLNEYAINAGVDITTPVPPFLPSNWNPLFTQYYLREFAGTYQLVYQPANFQQFDIEGEFTVQISNDVVVYGDDRQGVLVARANSRCAYYTQDSFGSLQFSLCNLNTNSATYNIQILSCTGFVQTGLSYPHNISVTVGAGDCNYSPAQAVNSTRSLADIDDSLGLVAQAQFGNCTYLVWDEGYNTVLFGSQSTPATIRCFEVTTQVLPLGSEKAVYCSWYSINCDEQGWALLAVILVPTTIVVSVIVILIVYAITKQDKEKVE